MHKHNLLCLWFCCPSILPFDLRLLEFLKVLFLETAGTIYLILMDCNTQLLFFQLLSNATPPWKLRAPV